MRRRRHQPVREQGKWRGQVVRGFFAYHAVPTNTRALNAFRHRVMDLWRRSLKPRSQRDRTTWERIASDHLGWAERRFARLPVEIDVASEFRYRKSPLKVASRFSCRSRARSNQYLATSPA